MNRILIIGLSILLSFNSFSQITINGVVKDEYNSLGLPGAKVTETGTENSTETDINGSYEITVSDSTSTLSFSFISYITREISVDGQIIINTTLKPYAIYEAWDQKLRFFLNSGLLENPIGGQFEFAVPTFINALSMYGNCSYQTNLNENNYFEAKLRLNGVRLLYSSNFYLGLGIESYYRNINYYSSRFEAISFETLWWSSLPFDLLVGYTQIKSDENSVEPKYGIILGSEFYISKTDLEVIIKGSFLKELIEYQTEIRKTFGKNRRMQTFIKYYDIYKYSELSIGIGIELTYYFKYQNNKY